MDFENVLKNIASYQISHIAPMIEAMKVMARLQKSPFFHEDGNVSTIDVKLFRRKFMTALFAQVSGKTTTSMASSSVWLQL